jgi:Peptidase family M28
VSLLPGAYVVGMIVTLWRDERTPFNPGAHDNAASVAVALEVGTRVASQPLAHTQVWLAFTGAEETDHAGLYAILREHGSVLRKATFLGLEGLGSGELVYLTRQGVCAHYTPDAELLALAEGVAAQRPELGARAAQMTGEDEVGTLRRTGYRALCIAGRDPATGTLPHWHRADDTPDTISEEFQERAVEFVMALLKAVDDQA